VVDDEQRHRIDVWRSLVIAHDTVMKRLQAELKRDFELTVPQYDALIRLAQHPQKTLRMTEVAEAMLYSSGAATKVFDRLVERGLVERAPHPDDRRVVNVTLTAEGGRLIDRAMRAHGDSIAQELGAFESDAERDYVTAFLRRLASPASEHPTE
jgi:DNA-binding MarR family transcriptional regulator